MLLKAGKLWQMWQSHMRSIGWRSPQIACQALAIGAFVFLSAQPISAKPINSEITTISIQNVQLKPTDTGLDIVLGTQSNALPQIVTLNRGNNWIAELRNTQLNLPQNKSFHQDHPAPGLDSLTIIPLDSNTVQVILTAPSGVTSQLKPRYPTGVILSLSRKNATISNPPPTSPAPSPPTSPTPSKAIAPPVGDIAIGDIDVIPTKIDLGTSERVPNLVLRDAPIREVLSVLAQTAGLNTVFLEGAAPVGGATNQNELVREPNISMDIKNESVENVFNYVLQVSRLQASRTGNTIIVGRNLPATSRGVILRSLRLNQLKATVPETELTMTTSAGSSLTSGGGGSITGDKQLTNTNSQIGRATSITQKIPVKGALQILEGLGANGGAAPSTATQNVPRARGVNPSDQLLNGLQVNADSRTNSVTLIGEPNLVKIAMEYLTQLDVRRRQVSVNVKIVEVSLNKGENIGSSFSFGVDESFFNVTNGQANANFGRLNPSSIPSPTGVFSPPIIQSPLNLNGIDGITRILEFPNKFLLNLQAKVTQNEAKILTDPTLIVQEGSASQVNLTTQVFGGFRNITEPAPGNQTRSVSEAKDPIDVGVILNIFVDQIDDHGYVTLAVSPEVSSPGERILDRDATLVQQLVNRRRLDTGNIRLQNGQTLILAGIIEESDRTITSKVPLLGDIPLLGALFRKTENEHRRNEVIVLITPTIKD